MKELKIITNDKIPKTALLVLTTITGICILLNYKTGFDIIIATTLMLIMSFIFGYPLFRLIFMNELTFPSLIQESATIERMRNELKLNNNNIKLKVAFLIFYGFFFLLLFGLTLLIILSEYNIYLF